MMLKTVNNVDITISGLKIISKIGEGGMSKVYLAEQTSLKRKVAVKVLRLEISENELDVQRFKHEAKTIALLDHPNIINIYNIGQTDKGEVFYTMPYLNHGDFSNYIIENEQEFIQLLQSISDGLSFAHDRGVIHRDIKPENLLFDEFGNVRIADFGIALNKNASRMTKEHQIVGSAQYMSPEQARSLAVDIHTDIYSLGIVIYERLTGKVPFDSDESISILVSHVSAKPAKLPAKMQHWQKFIDKCLAKDPKNRFQSMVELKIALSKIPTNGLQRTHHSIASILTWSKYQHFLWLIPALLFFILIGLVMTKSTSNIATNKQTPLTAISATSTNNTNTKADKTQAPIDDSQTKPALMTNVDNSSLSIDEIKQKIAQQNTQYGEVPVVLTEDKIKQLEQQEILAQAYKNIENYQLSKPSSNNATDQLLAVLENDPENPKALAGIELIGKKYQQLIDSALNKNDFITALNHAKSLQLFSQKADNAYGQNSRYLQQNAIVENIEKIDVAAASISIEQIKTLNKIIKLVAPENPTIVAFEKIIAVKTGPQIGDKLLDEMGIESILISQNLAVTTHEITVQAYSEFVTSSNRPSSPCKHEPGGKGSFFKTFTWDKPLFEQTPQHPVVCISLADAMAYAQWLSQQTDNKYRLPTALEWQSLATTQSESDQNACAGANIAGSESKKSRIKNQNYTCSDKFEFTAPVASFATNALGLFDITGNVSEWTECTETPCENTIAMGSSWFDGKKSNTPTQQNSYKANSAYTHIGFRLVRDI